MFKVTVANVVDPYLLKTLLPCYSEQAREDASRNILVGDDAVSLWYKDEIVGIMGVYRNHKKSMSAWALLSTGIMNCKKSFVKTMKEFIDDLFTRYEINRVSVLVDVENETAIRQNEWMGLQREGVLRKSGITGKDQVLLAKVRD